MLADAFCAISELSPFIGKRCTTLTLEEILYLFKTDHNHLLLVLDLQPEGQFRVAHLESRRPSYIP